MVTHGNASIPCKYMQYMMVTHYSNTVTHGNALKVFLSLHMEHEIHVKHMQYMMVTHYSNTVMHGNALSLPFFISVESILVIQIYTKH